MYKIGIIGYGTLGLACETGFQNIADVRVHDKFKDTESLDSVVKHSEIIFLCLPTPMDKNTGACDTRVVESVCKEINKIIKKSKIIVIKSSVIPGTTQRLQEKYKNHTFVFNPEFLREKTFIQDFMQQDRIILGSYFDGKRLNIPSLLVSFYEKFVLTQKNPAAIIHVDSKIAEMTKYVANCFLMTKVVFFNEMYEICKAANIKYDAVKNLVVLDERIGASHTSVPGHDGQFGSGGSCFPKDINALIHYAKEIGCDPLVLESIWAKNCLVRESYDWEKIPGVTGDYKKL